MNIAYYSHYFTPEIGAPSARIYDLSQQWLEQGHHVEVVTGFPNHPTGEIHPGYKLSRYFREVIDGINVHRNWTYVTPNQGFVKKSIGHVSLWPSARLSSEKNLTDVDIVIGTSPTFFAAIAAAGIAKRRKIPFVMEVRDLWPAIFIELGVLRNPQIIRILEAWEMWLYRHATKVVTVTESFSQSLVDRGLPRDKVHTIPNGADVDYWQPLAKPQRLADRLGLNGRFTVLYIGTHGISQALSSILESAAQLRDYPNIQFLFVGTGAEKAMLKKKAEDEQLDNIIFHDSVPKEDVQDYYALSDVCLVPLRDIPLFTTFIPSKMFEILASERPIIGSVAGEAANILRQSQGALVVPPEDGTAVANAILHLYQNPEQRSQMGHAGRNFVINHYSRQSLASRYAHILEEARDRYPTR